MLRAALVFQRLDLPSLEPAVLQEFWAQTPHQVLLGHTSSLVSYGPPSNLVYPEKFCPFPMGFMGCGSFLLLVVPRVPATGRGATCVGRRGGAGTRKWGLDLSAQV